MPDPQRRRRRTRKGCATGSADGTGNTEGTGKTEGTGGPTGTPAAGRRQDRDESSSERGLRGLVGGGSTQVGVGAAMRARDAARPTPDDMAASATELVIVRRGWVPTEELPRPGNC